MSASVRVRPRPSASVRVRRIHKALGYDPDHVDNNPDCPDDRPDQFDNDSMNPVPGGNMLNVDLANILGVGEPLDAVDYCIGLRAISNRPACGEEMTGFVIASDFGTLIDANGSGCSKYNNHGNLPDIGSLSISHESPAMPLTTNAHTNHTIDKSHSLVPLCIIETTSDRRGNIANTRDANRDLDSKSMTMDLMSKSRDQTSHKPYTAAATSVVLGAVTRGSDEQLALIGSPRDLEGQVYANEPPFDKVEDLSGYNIYENVEAPREESLYTTSSPSGPKTDPEHTTDSRDTGN